MDHASKKALLLASFGTLQAIGREALNELENELKHKLMGFSIIQVFTSNFIRRKLSGEGFSVESLEEALERLSKESYAQVVVLPTHLCTGKEYEEKVVSVTRRFLPLFPRLITGKPVLFFDALGYVPNAGFVLQLILRILPADFEPETTQAVLIGHGVRDRENTMYHWLRKILSVECPYITVGLLEADDCLGMEGILTRLTQIGKRKIVLIPFLLFRGNHVLKDLADDHDTSWKSVLLQRGYEVSGQWRGLMEFSLLRQFYLQQAEALVASVTIQNHEKSR